MARTPHPWFWEARGEWYVTIRGDRHRLGADKAEAERQFHALMARPPEAAAAAIAPAADGLAVAELLEKFLTWSHQHQAPRTYTDHRANLQLFLDEAEGVADLPALALRPFHVNEWVDTHPTWGDTRRRAVISSVQRAYSFALDEGHLDTNPVQKIKKPACGRREEAVTPEQWAKVRDHYPEGDPFRELLEVAWDTGLRPFEARTMEAQHVHLDRHAVLFPPKEAKGKKRWRIIRLTPRAAEIIRRRLGGRTEGLVFTNAAGRPWTPFAMNCRFCRLKKHLLGVKLFAYAWRHGFATRKLVEGHDHLTVAELMGHADGTMLARVYAHLDQEDGHLRKALNGSADVQMPKG